MLGIEVLAIVDRNSLAGIVRAHEAAKTIGVRLIVGYRVDLADGMSILAYPADRPAYGAISSFASLSALSRVEQECGDLPPSTRRAR
jgi:error-prone DNA polymerase